MIQLLRDKANSLSDENGNILIHQQDWKQYGLKIESNNNFPTAAGLASSASGFACLSTYFFS